MADPASPGDDGRVPNLAAVTPRSRVVAATVAALVVLGVGLVALTGGGSDQATPSSTTVISDQVVDDFLTDFEAGLTGTFIVRSTFERRRGDQLLGRGEQTVVQRGADRLTVRGGSVSGRLDGRVVTCDVGDDVACLVGEQPVDIEAETTEQMRTIREYVDGVDLLYGVSAIDPQDVTRIGGETDRCYSLELLRQIRVAPYGTFARFCYDSVTGAPTLIRVERPEAIDLTVATAVDAEVTDADLTLPD